MNSDMPFKKRDKKGQMMYNQSYLVSEIPIKISMIFHSDIVNPYSKLLPFVYKFCPESHWNVSFF
uniref:Uncharacterized protein n=1 Tax=Anguilla anguilla TaxID=7936 RepID=A0A0E9UFK8_ANGAN